MFAGGNLQSFNEMLDPNNFDLNDKIIYDMFANLLLVYKERYNGKYILCFREKFTGNIDPKIFGTKNNRYIMKSTCPSCKHKKWGILGEAWGILGMLGLKTPLANLPLVGPLLF